MNSMLTTSVVAQKQKTAEEMFSAVGLSASTPENFLSYAIATSRGIPF